MNKRILLEFPKTLTRLTDNPYGKQVFAEQVADKIDYQAENTIVFPKQIIKASSSFVQGFYSEIIKKIGYEGLDEHIIIESENTTLKESIKKNLL